MHRNRIKGHKVLFYLFGLALFIGIIWVYFFYIYGWYTFRKNTDTPSAYESHIVAPRQLYLADKDRLSAEMGQLLARKEGFFNNDGYFNGTKLIIDTILYSPDFNRMAVLLIVRNPTYRQLLPNRKYKWFYDGTIFLGVRSADSLLLFHNGPDLITSYNKRGFTRYFT